MQKALSSGITASYYSLVNTDARNRSLLLMSLPEKARSHICYFERERLQLFCTDSLHFAFVELEQIPNYLAY